jgi:hypothetical protein
VPGKEELKLRDVKATTARPDRPRPKPRAPTAAKRAKRLRPGNTIDRDARPPLKSPNSSPSTRPSNPINSSGIQALCT